LFFATRRIDLLAILCVLLLAPAAFPGQSPTPLQPLWDKPMDNIRAVRVSQSGDCAVVATLEHILLVSRSGRELWHWDFKKGNRFMSALNVAVAPDCDWLAVAGGASYRYTWIAHRNGTLIPIPTVDTPAGIAISHHGDLLAIGTGGGDVWLIRADGSTRWRQHLGYCCVQDLSFSADYQAILATRWAV